MLKKHFVTTTLSLVLLTGVAAASSGEYEREEMYGQRGPVPFAVLDINKDGVVTADEHAQMHRERLEYRSEHGYPMRNAARAPNFEQMDTDGNGSLSREELAKWQSQRMQQRGMGWNR